VSAVFQEAKSTEELATYPKFLVELLAASSQGRWFDAWAERQLSPTKITNLAGDSWFI
jgi:hypothetical protein